MNIRVDQFVKLTADKLLKNFATAGVYSVSKLRGYLNTAQTYTRSGTKLIGDNPSQAGHFPHKLSGQLQKSQTWSLDRVKVVLTIGSNLMGYPSFLEKGTRTLRARPWLTLFKQKEFIRIGKLLVK